jgi:hypothetical protein
MTALADQESVVDAWPGGTEELPSNAIWPSIHGRIAIQSDGDYILEAGVAVARVRTGLQVDCCPWSPPQLSQVKMATHACRTSDPQMHPSIDMQEADKLMRALRLHAREAFEKVRGASSATHPATIHADGKSIEIWVVRHRSINSRAMRSESRGRETAAMSRVLGGTPIRLGQWRRGRSPEKVSELSLSLNHLVKRRGCQLCVMQRKQPLEDRNCVLSKHPFV